jgi:hypothetical protein
MAKRSKPSTTLPSPILAAAQKLMVRFPVTTEADAPAFKELLDAVVEALQPRDIIEMGWVMDVGAHTWRVQHLRSVEATLLTPESADPRQALHSPAIQAQMDENLVWFSTPIAVLDQRPRTEQERQRLVEEFARDHPEKYQQHLRDQADSHKRALEEFATIIPSKLSRPEPTQHTMSADEANRLAAEVFKKNSRDIDLTSRQSALYEALRNTALRELERYRSVRQAGAHPEEILDAEYTEAAPPKRQRRS